MTHAAPLPLLLAALCLAYSGTAGAAEDDAISSDRPSVAESSQVVGKGRFQLETGLQWERQRDETVHERTLTTPTLLRIGLGERAELRIETDGRTIIHDADPASGLHTVTAGYADTSLGVKWHLADQREGQAGRPSLGVLLHADLPSGSRELRGRGLRPSLRLAADWELANAYSLSVMPGLGIDSDERGARYGYGVLAVELDKAFNERLHGFAELAAPQIARAAHGGTQAVFDAGLTYLVSKNIQVDAALMHGLNRRTPDLSLTFGLSLRR
ncbi:transporter [Massilia sp. LXY-6]|uniref:transporter n=1 Tax=Massilia sp. LXY-6 TaxID=3379823 RepID=UPI003EE3721D